VSLLISDNALAATNVAIEMPFAAVQVAESNIKSPNKLGDKYLDGKAGAIYRIGGSEPHVKYFKSRVKRIPLCCGRRAKGGARNFFAGRPLYRFRLGKGCYAVSMLLLQRDELP
jgi:hypothetical protein